MNFIIRKYDGDDAYSWAVFSKESLPKGHCLLWSSKTHHLWP
jgi:hypothetical protein